MPAGGLTDTQRLALVARAAFTATALDSFGRGVRDASNGLRAILEQYPDDLAVLRRALVGFVRGAPEWDRDPYLDGHAAVHDDVKAVLDNDRGVIAELLETLNAETEGA